MPTQLRSLAATLLIAVPALCHSAQTALAQNNPGGAAAPPAMLCQGPEGLYRVSYDAETGFVDFNGESYPVMMPPEDAGGIAMIWEEGPVLIGLAAMWVRYESLDGMRTLRQDRCRAVPASTARPGGEATVPLSEVQRLLNQLGFDAGAVDGVMGPRTRRAIAEFQRSIGEDGTGRLSVAQAARLAETAGAARAAHGDSQDGGEAAPASPGTARPTFQDCDVCPVMLELPPGRFMMGASDKDKATPLTEWDIPSELPRHEVVIDDPIAIGKYEVTVEEFEAYVQETGAEVGGICGIAVVQSGPHGRKFTGTKHPKSDAFSQTPNLVYIADGSYAQPGLPISPRQPAVCVSRNEVRGYLNWLSSKTGRIYRLPSEAEWEYAARAGTQTVAFWGDDLSLACDYANFGDRASGYQAGFAAPCSEDVRPLWAAEVGSYEPNDWGLHDMAGNVTEMLQDCWHENYQGAPADGSAWEEEDCLLFVARGGDYGSLHISTRAADRGFFGYVEEVPQIEGKEVSHDGRSNLVGFRVAASMTDTASAAPPPPDNASSQAPSRAGAPAVTWTAASGTAIAITGNLTVSGDELIFGDGTRLALDFVAEEQSVWAAGGVSTGRIFRLDPPRDPVLLNGNTLCGMPEPVTYLVLSEPSPDSLALTVFTSPSPPSGFGDRSCATYFYQR